MHLSTAQASGVESADAHLLRERGCERWWLPLTQVRLQAPDAGTSGTESAGVRHSHNWGCEREHTGTPFTWPDCK